MPTECEIRQFITVNNIKYSILTNVFDAVDGFKLLIHPPSSINEQNVFFIGWKYTHNVNGLFVFSPDRKIKICLLMHQVHFTTVQWQSTGFTRLWKRFMLNMGKSGGAFGI